MGISRKSTSWLVLGSTLVAAVLAMLVMTGAINIPYTAGSHTAHATAGAQPADPGGPPPVPVTVAPLTLRPIQRVVEVVGSFEGLNEVEVAPKVPGRVVKLYHDLGDSVRPGDPLLEIDRVDYQLAVEEARKELESELAKLGLTALPRPDFDLNQLPTVVRAWNLQENLARKLKRAEQLRQNNTLTQEDLEQVKTDFNIAQATRLQTILDAQSTLATARHKQSLLATALQRLEDTEVKVPQPTLATSSDVPLKPDEVKYVVAARMVSEGEMVRAGVLAPAFRLVIDQMLKLRATVPERYVGQVKGGQSVQLQVEAYPDKVFEGTISRVSPTVDRINRTFQIEVMVPNESRQLKAGGFAKAAILTGVDPQAKTVPVESLITFIGTTKVFVVEDGKAHAVEVVPGVGGRGWVEVAGELGPQSQVIISGLTQLAEGTPVAIRQPEQLPGGPQSKQEPQAQAEPAQDKP